MPDLATDYIEVKVIVHRIQRLNEPDVFRLDVAPLLLLISPQVDGEPDTTVGVKWTLDVRPPDDFPYIARLTVSFKGSQTPFSETTYLPETFTAHATAAAVSDNSGHIVLSGPVLNTAVDPAPDAAIKSYDYTVTVSLRLPDNSSNIPDIILDPPVLVRRKKLGRDRSKWQEW